ncbi:histidine kinase [Actinoplanes sp. NBRC 103695]|uniref:sensor histidine kinase n=1 Tax=Actinoplanes sp. NBRC 103695 TaxID=3032202 RepID=UPI002555D7E9|nr:histidine kinase [Actinoplanes sp. NBRC 103695]
MRWSRDALIAAVVVGLSFTPWVRDKGTAFGFDTPQRPFDLLAAALVLAHALPLVVRTRFPALCLALVSLAFAAYQILGFRPTFASVALYLALFTAGVRQRRGRWVTVSIWTLGYAVTCALLVVLDSPAPLLEYFYFFATPAACWLGGGWARGELLRREEQHRHAVAWAARDEREHLARELHDVVTHHVTAMIMQADAARFVPADDRPAVEKGLRTVGDTGRRALTDLRQLLNVLSPDTGHAPRIPSTGRLADLVEQTRLAGQPVEFIEEGEVESAVAYRVVQEGLTNAMKHAPGRPTVVRAVAAGDSLTVEVTTAGPGGPVRPGRGITGLRRRVRLAGGDLSVYRDDDGAFVVRATL